MRTRWRQLRLILWKNYLSRKRQKVRLAVEIIWPLSLILLLAWVRTRGLRKQIDECHVSEKSLPSAGALAFIQSWLCSIRNNCEPSPEKAKIPPPDLSYATMTKMMAELVKAFQDSGDADLFAPGRAGSRMVGLASRISRPGYEIEPWPLKDFLREENTLKRDLDMKIVNVSPENLQEILDFKLLNTSYNFSPYALLLDNPSSLQCKNVSKNLTTSELAVNQFLCEMEPGEIKRLTEVFNAHWNSSIEKDTVRQYIGTGLDRQMSLGDVLEARTVLGNISEETSKERSPRIDNSSTTGNDVGVAAANAILEKYLCNRTKDDTSSLIENAKNKASELQLDVKERTVYRYDNLTTPKCNALLQRLQETPEYYFIFRMLKPILLGQILYTPVTPKTDQIMKLLNDTFMQFDDYKKLIVALAGAMNSNDKRPNPLQRAAMLVQNPAILTAANSTRAQDVLKRLIARIESNGTSGTFVEYLECLEYNKVRGIDDYFEAEQRASELLDSERLYALVVFDSEYDTGNNSERSKRDTSGQRRASANMVPNTEKKAFLRDSVSSKNVSSEQPTNSSFSPRTVFRIRMDAWIVDDTKNIRDRFQRNSGRYRPVEDLKYITYGFIYLQDMIELSIISAQTGTPIGELPGTMLHQYPHPCYIVDELIRAVSGTFPLIMVLAWLFTCAMIVKSVVLEKELRLKQTMQVMGLKNYIFWIGWFIESLIPMTFVVLLVSFVLIYGKVVFYSDGTTIFVLLFLYALATICLSFLLSCFFSRANIAAACGGIIFFILYLPYPMTVRWRLSLPGWAKYISCLSSNVALGFGAAYMAEWESQGLGLTWERIGISPVYGDSFNVSYVMLMLIVDCIIYCLLTWYIEAVFPGQYGIPLPWNFFATRSYWFGTSYKSSKVGLKNASEIANSADPKDSGAKSSKSLFGEEPPNDDSNLEREPTMLNRGVEIKNLTKVYSNGKVAVKDLNMNFYENQITSFLGHNGAGKTTTISILTGIYPPTSGTAYVSGYDIRTQLSEVRKNLGMCPQFNVLFSRLTVLEHLQFYGYLRGNPTKEVSKEFEQMLIDLNLPDKRHSFPGDLSGGMQRKLSIAAAFIGGSKVVILDEPTSGVDPYSRRSIWELLLKYKQGRTVILTTHYMDEADLLGDRIGIISNGQMKCSGSSMFLKNKFGSGFILTVELIPKTPRDPKPGEVSSDKIKSAQDDNAAPESEEIAITSVVKRYIPDASVQSQFGNEVIYALPTKDGKLLEGLCSTLDDDLGKLGGVSYGVSDTSLEEIFLRITDDDMGEDTGKPGFLRKRILSIKSVLSSEKSQDYKDEKVVRLNGANVTYTQVPIITGEHVQKKPSNMYWRQFFALHIKRFHHYKRNTKSIFSELVLPPILVAISLAVLHLVPNETTMPPLELTPSLYGNDLHFHARTQSDGVGPEYRESIVDSFGLGTDCLFWNGTENPCNPKAEFFDNANYKMAECSCSSGAQVCPSVIDEPPPPHDKIVNNYTVVDSDKFDPSAWFLKTVSKYSLRNLGGFEFGADSGVDNKALVDLKDLGGFVLDRKLLEILPDRLRPKNKNIKVWFNNKAWASSVANLNAIHNNMLRVHVIKNGSLPKPWQQYGIEAYSHPMEYTERQRLVEAKKMNPQSLLQAIAVIFALSFVTASFCMYLIEERISSAKHLQLVSGVSRLVYWVQAFTWDYFSFMISVLLCVFVFLMFDAQAYISKEHFPAFLMLLALYGWSCIPMMYPPSFFFSVPSTAFVSMGCGNVFVGILTTISVSVLENFDDDELRRIGRILREVFLIFPQFCLGDGMMKLAISYHLDISLVQFGIEVKAELYSWSYLGKNFLAMFLLGVIFFLTALLIEFKVASNIMGMCRSFVDRHTDRYVQRVARQQAKAVIISVTPGFAFFRLPLARRLLKTRFFSSLNAMYESLTDCVAISAAEFLTKNKFNVDVSVDEEDVAFERKRVHNNPDDLLLIKELSKKYPRKATPSVNKICIGVKKGECFGLLGLNGAGKTTTFKMLTGAVKPTSGDARVGGFSIRGKSINDVRALLGYCPQFDALDPLLTPTEHLMFYARVRNIPSDVLHTRVDLLMKRMNLISYRNKLAGNLSGGNKRKLSTAIALLGNPPLVFLDEPTSGMDPKARRFLWNCISDVVKEGGCVILTSHSMEECQALCSRLTIMVNGQLTCLGSSQHLKNKYGKGYLLIVRCADTAKDQVKTFISKRLPTSKITEEHYTQLRYEVPVSRLSKILHEMEDAKSRKIVTDYSVMQTTLEEVFIRFAREQADPDDRKPGKSGGLLKCCSGKGSSV